MRLVLDDGAQALGFVHHVDGGVDGLHALQLVGDEVLHGQLAAQKALHQLRHLYMCGLTTTAAVWAALRQQVVLLLHFSVQLNRTNRIKLTSIRRGKSDE